MDRIKAVFTILAVLVWTGIMVTAQAIVLLLFRKHRYLIPRIFHKGLCRLLKVKVVTSGVIERSRPTLFVVNHISWLDIPVVGSALQGSFVAKREVAKYPLVGPVSKLQQTIFIERTRPAVRSHKGEMQERLKRGENLFLFPEGTSSNGIIIQDFKSAYFGLAERRINGTSLTVQPVTLAYSRMNGIAMTRGTMGIVAWVGDEALPRHVWAFLKRGRITAELRLHPPVTIDSYDSRKAMASDCQMIIARSLSRALTGREEPETPEFPHR